MAPCKAVKQTKHESDVSLHVKVKVQYLGGAHRSDIRTIFHRLRKVRQGSAD